MDYNSDTIMTPIDPENLQLEKCVNFVSALDAKICAIERQLTEVSEIGQSELCHSLEMRNDEKVHILATLEEKVRTQLGDNGH